MGHKVSLVYVFEDYIYIHRSDGSIRGYSIWNVSSYWIKSIKRIAKHRPIELPCSITVIYIRMENILKPSYRTVLYYSPDMSWMD